MKRLLLLLIGLSALVVSCMNECDVLKSQTLKESNELFHSKNYMECIDYIDSIKLTGNDCIDKKQLKLTYKMSKAEIILLECKELFKQKKYKKADKKYVELISYLPMYRPAVSWYNNVDLYKLSK